MAVIDSLHTFTGFVDEATMVESTNGSLWLLLEGWILAQQGPISKLQFSIPQTNLQTDARRVDRPDVAQQHPFNSHAQQSGFRVSLPLQSQNNITHVEFVAELQNGSLIRSRIDIRPNISLPIYKHVEAVHRHGLSSNPLEGNSKVSLADYRTRFLTSCAMRYRNFLESGERLSIRRPRVATVSVVIPVAHQESLTYACLENLHALRIPGLEIIVVDNANSAETGELIKRFPGVKRAINRGKHTFSHACNLGAKRARGKYLLFLNNDAFPLAGAIEAVVSCLETYPACGASGGKVIRPDGRIQEVGSFILPTGATVSRGRGATPAEQLYCTPIRVDYCSAAFLLTPKDLFSSIGGFDEHFDPAYYEDTDYCLRLAQAGHPCVVEPRAVVLHLERGTTDQCYNIDTLMTKGLQIFQSLHPEFSRQAEADCIDDSGEVSRGSRHGKPRRAGTSHASHPQKRGKTTRRNNPRQQSILVIDDSIPDATLGQGQGRSALLLETLENLKLDTSWYSAHKPIKALPQPTTSKLSFVRPKNSEDKISFLRRMLEKHDIVLVSRPHHMEKLQIALRSLPTLNKVPKIVYDAEAIQATREVLRFEIQNNVTLSDDEIASILRNEVIVARDADRILAASELEASTFVDFGFAVPHIVSYGIQPRLTSTPFESRSHFLTVGPMLERDTPNTDAVLSFTQSIFPRIISHLKTSKVALHCVGDCQVEDLFDLQGVNFKLLGQIEDLFPVYSCYRVMVAPTRFSAGIPLKVIEAASYGVPCVVTPVVARQLEWSDDVELLVGYSAADFAAKCATLYQDEALWMRIRKAAFERVCKQFRISSFQASLSAALTW